MTELSIFIDESGDAGPVSRYYIVTLVFHEQAIELNANIAAYERNVKDCELDIMPFHFGPLLTGHDDYQWVNIRNRKKQLSLFRQFVDRSPITYQPFIYDKICSICCSCRKLIASFILRMSIMPLYPVKRHAVFLLCF